MSDPVPNNASATPNVPSDLEKRKRRNRNIVRLSVILILAGCAAFAYWFFFIRFRESTEDAYVNGNAIMLMSSVSANAITIYADNTNYVEQGQLLVELDRTYYQLAFDKAMVDLALAARQVRQLFEEVEQRKADILLRKAELHRTHQDYQRRIVLRHSEAIAQEDIDHAVASYEVALATLNVAQHQLESAIASLGDTPLNQHPLIESAKVALQNAYVNLMHCEILSPANGIIAQRGVQVGEWVSPGRALMSVVPLDQMWVDTNFRETQLSDIRIGQPTTLISDMYGSHIVYHGKVQGIVPGTGTVFSLLPAQNATGNWIKLVQRVPVRILLDPQEIKEHPLFLGLSMTVTVDTSDTSGKQVAEHPLREPQYFTGVFHMDLRPIDPLIQKIIQTNLFPTEDPPPPKSS